MPAFRARQRQARAAGRYLGIGFATFSERTGYGTPAFAARGMDITPGWETVELAMDPSGFVEVRIGASPHGQGLRTTLAQLIADELGLAPDRIKVMHGDTDRTPYGWGTFASRSLVISGGACVLAARKVRAKLKKIASHLLEAAADDIVLDRRRGARRRHRPRRCRSTTLARAAYHQSHLFKGEIDSGFCETATYDPPGTFSNACHAAIVEVDAETGRVTIERFVVAEDAGRLINPMIADGQMRRRRRARHRQRAARRDRLRRGRQHPHRHARRFSAADRREIPPIELLHLETLDATRPITKAKGLGEGGAIGAPAAVLNADQRRAGAVRREPSRKCRRRRSASVRRCGRQRRNRA